MGWAQHWVSGRGTGSVQDDQNELQSLRATHQTASRALVIEKYYFHKDFLFPNPKATSKLCPYSKSVCISVWFQLTFLVVFQIFLNTSRYLLLWWVSRRCSRLWASRCQPNPLSVLSTREFSCRPTLLFPNHSRASRPAPYGILYMFNLLDSSVDCIRILIFLTRQLTKDCEKLCVKL